MSKCTHPKKDWILQTIGGLSLVGGDFWDDSQEIVICVNCGNDITKIIYELEKKQEKKLMWETSLNKKESI